MSHVDPGNAGRLTLRPIEHDHLDVVLALNNAEIPRVSPLDADTLSSHLQRCEVALVAVDADGAAAGFVLALGPGSDYRSVNYRFFAERGTDFLYVDRVVVAPTHRRRGVAGLLYDAVEASARAAGRAEVTCEVNVRPSNDGSVAFHAARGFVEVGRQDTTAGTLTVSLLALPLR